MTFELHVTLIFYLFIAIEFHYNAKTVKIKSCVDLYENSGWILVVKIFWLLFWYLEITWHHQVCSKRKKMKTYGFIIGIKYEYHKTGRHVSSPSIYCTRNTLLSNDIKSFWKIYHLRAQSFICYQTIIIIIIRYS